MSKSAALLLALALGANACTQPEPEQTIIAVVEADSSATSVSEDPDSPDPDSPATTEQESDAGDPDGEKTPPTVESSQSESTQTTTAPATTAPSNTAPSTTMPESSDSGAQQLLAASLSPAAEFSSVRFDGAMVMSGNADGDSFEIQMIMRGGHDEAAQTSEFFLDMSSMTDLLALGDNYSAEDAAFAEAMLAEPLQMITVGNKGWVKWGMLTLFTGETDKWVEMDVEEAMELDFDGSNPTDMLEALSGADGGVENLGTEKIRGVNTTHYVLNLDMDDYLDGMSRREAAEISEIVGTLDELPLHLWLDGNGLMRRMEMQVSAAEFGSFTQDEFEMSVWFEMFDYGADLKITPPPASDVISQDELSLTS